MAVFGRALSFVRTNRGALFVNAMIAIQSRQLAARAGCLGRTWEGRNKLLVKPARGIDRVIGCSVHAVNQELCGRLAIGGVVVILRDCGQRRGEHEGEHRRHDANHKL